jgi:hypothetical protein
MDCLNAGTLKCKDQRGSIEKTHFTCAMNCIMSALKIKLLYGTIIVSLKVYRAVKCMSVLLGHCFPKCSMRTTNGMQRDFKGYVAEKIIKSCSLVDNKQTNNHLLKMNIHIHLKPRAVLVFKFLSNA